MDHVKIMPSHRLAFDIHRVLVITMKKGPDVIFLETNLPDPMGAGTLAFSFQVPRATGLIYAQHTYRDVEIVCYDYGINRSYGFDERTARTVAQTHEQQNPQLERLAGMKG